MMAIFPALCLQRLVALEEKQSALSHHEWFPKFLSALLKVRLQPRLAAAASTIGDNAAALSVT